MGEGLPNEYIFSAVHEISQTFEILILNFNPRWGGVKHFLLIFCAVHDIPRTFETGVGWVKFVLAENESHIYANVCQIWLGSDGRARKKGGGGGTDTNKGALRSGPPSSPPLESFLPSCLPPVHPPSFHPRITRLRSLPGFA